MSNTIREYKSISHKGLNEGRDLSLTSTSQGKYPSAIQFTIGDKYCVLSENQLLDMIKTINKRIKCKRGYSATDTITTEIIYPKKIKQ